MVNFARSFYYLATLLRRAYWDSERLERYQNKRLRELTRYAYDFVPFYHKQFRKLGLKPSDIKTKKDLNKLPIIQKDLIRENLNDMISVEFDVKDLKRLSTSGSTGKPLFLYINAAESEFRKAKHLRANLSCGQKPRDKWVTITAPHHFGESSGLQKILGVFAPTPLSVFTEPDKQIEIIRKLNPDILEGYSSSLFILAKEFEKNDAFKPRVVFGGAELVDSYSRQYIEKVFGTKFIDQYASVEMERIAWQCPVAEEYHIDADALVLQFVDKNGEEVSPGEKGEIVCTSLFSYSMPFIRYAIGDLAVPSDGLCSCGRCLPLMKSIEGRKDSLLVLPNGRTLTPRAFTICMNMFKYYNCIDQFRVIQREQDFFEFNIALKASTINENVLERELVTHLSRVLNLNQVSFNIRFVKAISLEKTGKLMAVVSKL